MKRIWPSFGLALILAIFCEKVLPDNFLIIRLL
jgi:hypothetical protein